MAVWTAVRLVYMRPRLEGSVVPRSMSIQGCELLSKFARIKAEAKYPFPDTSSVLSNVRTSWSGVSTT